MMMIKRVRLSCLLFIAIESILLDSVFPDDYFCSSSPQKISLSSGETVTIHTRANDTQYYSESLNCKWNIDTKGQRLNIFVKKSDLQYAPPGSLCGGFDHVTLIDRNSNMLLKTWCGNEYPDVINTKGNQLTVQFTSDSITPSTEKFTTGTVIQITAFASSDCPPGWKEIGTKCFKRRTTKAGWFQAHENCNLEHGNLASINSKEEFDFVRANFNSSGLVWIGLNDLAKPTTFKWIDTTFSGSFTGANSLTPNEFSHCVALDAISGQLTIEDCERRKFESLCKANRDLPLTLYPVPKESTDKGSGSSGRTLLLGLLVPAAILLVIVIVGAYIYKKRSSGPQESKQRERSVDSESSSTRNPLATAPMSTLTIEDPQHVAPPTYEQSLNDPVASNRPPIY